MKTYKKVDIIFTDPGLKAHLKNVISYYFKDVGILVSVSPDIELFYPYSSIIEFKVTG